MTLRQLLQNLSLSYSDTVAYAHRGLFLLSLSLVQAHKQFHRQAVQVKRPKPQKSVRDLQFHLVMRRKLPSQPRITSTEHQIVSWPDICSTRTICKKFTSVRGSKIWQGEAGKEIFLPYLHAIIHIGLCKFFTPSTECSTTQSQGENIVYNSFREKTLCTKFFTPSTQYSTTKRCTQCFLSDFAPQLLPLQHLAFPRQLLI